MNISDLNQAIQNAANASGTDDSADVGRPVNRQLYENSGLRELFADSPPAEGSRPGFFNARDPNLAIQHEKPEHRLLLWMKAQGASNREIAQQSGYTQPWISQLMRQPWAQQRLVEFMSEAGMDVVQQTLKAAAPDSVFTLIALRDDTATPPAVRRSAADSLLDRYLGKPHQSIDVRNTQVVAPTGDIDEQLSKLQTEVARLEGKV